MAMFEGQQRNWHVSNMPRIALLLLLLLQLGITPSRANFLWNLSQRSAAQCDGRFMSKPYDSVTGIGDIDGNGFDDFAVGYADGGASRFGTVYILFMVSSWGARCGRRTSELTENPPVTNRPQAAQ